MNFWFNQTYNIVILGGWEVESGRMKKEIIIFPFSTIEINGWCQKGNNQEVAIKESLRYSEEIGKN